MHDGWSRRRTAQPERAPPSSLQPELPRSLARRGNRPSFRSSIFQVPCSMLHAPKCVRPRPEMNTRARGLPRFGVMSVSPVMKHEVRRPLALVRVQALALTTRPHAPTALISLSGRLLPVEHVGVETTPPPTARRTSRTAHCTVGHACVVRLLGRCWAPVASGEARAVRDASDASPNGSNGPESSEGRRVPLAARVAAASNATRRAGARTGPSRVVVVVCVGRSVLAGSCLVRSCVPLGRLREFWERLRI